MEDLIKQSQNKKVEQDRLDIMYEDEDLLVINKPAGIVIHPGAGNYDNTIVNALMNYCGKSLSNIKKFIDHTPI